VVDSREIKTMRNMAWNRIKGELEGVLLSFWDDLTNDEFQELDHLIHKFMEKFNKLTDIN